ncbi:MAG: urease accessory protein [Acidobacteria bacterium]|nr:urease accessory protein [Acidobacteriota bacterium]
MSDPTLAAVLLLGFTLGLRHTLDADHLAAVTALTSDGGGIRRAGIAGLSWGLGHAVMLGVFGGALVLMRVPLSERVGGLFEMAAALMLIWLGATTVVGALRGRVHVHTHRHGDVEHSHLHFHAVPHHGDALHCHPHPLRAVIRPFLVGGVHGLAGSGAVALVVLATIPTWLYGTLYLGVLGAGSVVGMTLMSVVVAAPLVLARRRAARVQRSLRLAAGIGSIAIGAHLAWGIGLGGWLPG